MWKKSEELIKKNINDQLETITGYLNDRLTNSSFSKVSKTSRNSDVTAEIDDERVEFERVLVSLNVSYR
jgi:hypothetical protein